jgi:magnesium transporter
MTDDRPAPTLEEAPLQVADLEESWRLLTAEDRLEGLSALPRSDAEDFFLGLAAADQADLVLAMPANQRRAWMRMLAPDDAADLVQAAPTEDRDALLGLLDDSTRREVTALLAYAEDDAGGLMNPRFARLRPDMSVDEAIRYLRIQARERLESLNYLYVLDAEQKLLGVVAFQDLFAAPAERTVRDIMNTDVITASEDLDQEAVSRLFAQHDLLAMPVVDAEGRMKGVVTVDDIVDVVQEEATEDIQKIGGTEALNAPYLRVGFVEMVSKRARWLAVLFLGEMFTATAMATFEDEIARAVVLAVFVPLIISSGGNSGSQASTLVVRALALGELQLADWWRVMRREAMTGFALGSILGVLAFLRVMAWEWMFHTYGAHALLVGITVAFTIVGIVTWGALSGGLLPFILRRFGADPASASAPFVATLVDVTGIVIYFSIASLVLRGTLL